MSVTDEDGASGSLAAQGAVVVYAPSGGFATRTGWIDSPAGAYAPDAAVSGHAIFAFVSKYVKGRTTPTRPSAGGA